MDFLITILGYLIAIIVVIANVFIKIRKQGQNLTLYERLQIYFEAVPEVLEQIDKIFNEINKKKLTESAPTEKKDGSL